MCNHAYDTYDSKMSPTYMIINIQNSRRPLHETEYAFH